MNPDFIDKEGKSWKLNPEWEKLENEDYFVPLCQLPGQYDAINIGPPPTNEQLD